jgi:hypothetical protein
MMAASSSDEDDDAMARFASVMIEIPGQAAAQPSLKSTQDSSQAKAASVAASNR